LWLRGCRRYWRNWWLRRGRHLRIRWRLTRGTGADGRRQHSTDRRDQTTGRRGRVTAPVTATAPLEAPPIAASRRSAVWKHRATLGLPRIRRIIAPIDEGVAQCHEMER